MYLGEGKCFYERMGEFVKVVKNLEIKEISKGLEMKNEEETFTEGTVIDEEDIEEVDEPKQAKENYIKQKKSRPPMRSNANKPFHCSKCEAVFANKDNLMRHNRLVHEATEQCHLQTHIQSLHDGIKYPCNQCDYQAKRLGHLREHIESKHEGIKYLCDHCNYQASQQSALRRHMKSKHGSIKYPCNDCDYSTTRKQRRFQQ